MRAHDFEVRTTADGSVIIRPTGSVGLDRAVELRQLVVRTVRHVRPLRLVLDFTDVGTIDSINVGTVAAACTLGDDHQVIVFVDNPRPELAERLCAAGVPAQRLRYLD
uniref:STAS domain-containing protein n=1 Tax=Paractinoplanes polyasparticus TaxID=2856853 RepID=UPI001C85B82A|nr:STAS domain-containing protein [Actinoplanes polyasparticus]